MGKPEDVRTWPTLNPLASHARAVVTQADQAAIAEPTARLMGRLGTLLWAKALHQEAEDLKRRALALDESHFGPESTQVAVRLNNLAQTLQATNRLAEAEPLMRRMLKIFIAFKTNTGHEHPHWRVAIGNYSDLLKAMGKTDAEVESVLASLREADR